MNVTEAKAALESDVTVRARYAYPPNEPATHAIGRVIAVCEAPSVLVLTQDGEHVWWRADLTEVITEQAVPWGDEDGAA